MRRISFGRQKQVEKEQGAEKEKEKSKTEHHIYYKAYNLLGKYATTRIPKIAKLEKNLELSMLPISYDVYVSAMLLFAIIGAIAGLAVGIALAILLDASIALKVAMPVVGLLFGAQMGFGVMYVYPSLLVNTRKRMIAEELPYFISYMSMLAASGMIPEGMFRTIAKEESKESMVQDARRVIRNIDLLGMDFVTALREIANRSPLTAYTELLEGLISTIRSGGDMNEFFSSSSRVMMEEKKLAVKKFGETLGMLAEIYTIMLVVFPLMAMIMLAVMAIMSKDIGGIDIILAMRLVTYIFVPMVGLMVIMMIESMMPKR